MGGEARKGFGSGFGVTCGVMAAIAAVAALVLGGTLAVCLGCFGAGFWLVPTSGHATGSGSATAAGTSAETAR